MNDRGKVLWRKKLARDEVLPYFATLAIAKVGIEACAGAHYWARRLNAQGHDARLIAAQHVKPFVCGSKNDWNDAQAIAEVRSRAETMYVPINTEAQQDMQMPHRARQALLVERKGVICRIRAFAGEYGKVFPCGVNKFRKGVDHWLGDANNGLSGQAVETLRELLEQLDEKDKRQDAYDARIARAASEDERARRLMQVPGIGKLTATAVVAAVADPRHFPSSRDLAANLGLVPRQHSSGGKDRLFGITKRGDGYLRTLLIHCARSALCRREARSHVALGLAGAAAQALMRNVRTCRSNAKGEAQAEHTRKSESTDAEHRGGVIRSRDESPVMRPHRRGDVAQEAGLNNRQREDSDRRPKPFDITKREVREAWKKVKANQGAAGIDGQSIGMFEEDLRGNLYKLWNRLASGSYLPPPVRRVEIEKAGGGTRPLGIPTVIADYPR